MPQIRATRRSYFWSFIVFQVVFVAVQVFIFYPCWQAAPGSTVLRVFRSDSRGHHHHGSPPDAGGGTPRQYLKQQEDEKEEEVLRRQAQLQQEQNMAQMLLREQEEKLERAQQQEQNAGQVKAPMGAQGVAAQPTSKSSPEKELKERQPQQKSEPIRYQPNWNSLDSRPIPEWYDDAKIGIFIHWGVFSVPSYVGVGTKGLAEWFWFYWKNEEFVHPIDEYHQQKMQMFLQKKTPAIKSVKDFAEKMYNQRMQYTDFAPKFRAEMFDPAHWADIFKESGAKYVVLTSKHHEGYTLWPSKNSWNWNAGDVGPHRDLVGDLGAAVRAVGLKYGLYYSLYEWFNPLYNSDKLSGFKTQQYIKDKMMPELLDLVNTYKPDIVWSDGEFEAPCDYWNCTQFLTWLYNDSPVKDNVVTNDRWGTDVLCKHGGYLTCHDRYNPEKKQTRKWENCMTIDRESWGYRRNAVLKDYYTMESLLSLLVQTVSYGGNLLMNIGPTADGCILPIYEERLRQMGSWLKVNGEGIYGTHMWHSPKDSLNSNVYYTSKQPKDETYGAVYAIVLKWPDNDVLELGIPTPTTYTEVTWLGYTIGTNSILWKKGNNKGMTLSLPKISLAALPCQWAWVFKITKLENM